MKTSRIYLTISILLTLVAGSSGAALAASAIAPGSPQPLVSRVDGGLSLAWQIPDASFSYQPDGAASIHLPGFETTQDPGSPELPFYSTLVALPPGASPTLTVVEADSSWMALAQPLAVAPQPVLTRPDGTAMPGSFSPQAASQPSLKLAELVPLGDLRGVGLARLTVHPVLPEAGGVQLIHRLKVEIRFNTGLAAAQKAAQPVLADLAGLVINPEDIAAAAPAAGLKPAALSAVQAGQAAIEVASEGLYRVTYAELAAIGFPVASVNPHNLHLTWAGTEIAIELEGNGDNTFDAGDSLLFYARPRTNRWSNTDVYFLSANNVPGRVVSIADASITSETQGATYFEQTFEQNGFYTPDCGCAPIPAGRDGDRWVWDEAGIQRNFQPSASRSFPFSLSNADFSMPSTLTVWLIGFTDPAPSPNHRVEVSVNNTLVGTMEWKGKLAEAQKFIVPEGVLQAANNLTFTLPGIAGVDIEGVWLDAFSFEYQPGSVAWANQASFSGSGGSGKYYRVNMSAPASSRVYDVTDIVTPNRLNGMTINGSAISFADKAARSQPRYLAVSDAGIQAPAAMHLVPALKTAGVTGADYIMIAPADFASSLSSLVSLRNSQGLATVVEDLQAIYDQYGGGIPQPEAIHAFLQDIYTRWNPKPLYALLVGDGTNDPKQYYPGHFKSIIPPFLADFDPFSTEGATDNLYVTFGGPADVIPDMLIGRLPANSVDELNGMVNKIVQFETHPVAGNWRNRATFLAARTDSGGDFGLAATSESALLLTQVPVERIYYPDPVPTVPDAKTALLDAWNSGTGLVVFNGHAGIHQWATHDENGNFAEFFHVSGVPALTNGGKLPVVLSMTCYTGAFQTPGLSTLDETLVRATNGGALATWGSTGLGTTSAHQFLAQGFVDKTVSQANTRLGEAALAGKLQLLAKHPSAAYLVDSFNLLGDPSSILTFIKSQKNVFVPIIFTP